MCIRDRLLLLQSTGEPPTYRSEGEIVTASNWPPDIPVAVQSTANHQPANSPKPIPGNSDGAICAL
eukprot:4486437-Amphidinium_carterae.1